MSTTLTTPVFILLLIALVLMALGAMVTHPLPQLTVPIPAHALEKHNQDAVLANQCLQGPEGYLFHNPGNDRSAVVCWLGDRWGIVILDKDMKEITSWVTNKLKSIEKVVEYMARQGYVQQ